jgi:predicted dehydrogenase
MIRAAIVGLGWWGRTIVRTMQNSEKLKITSALDVDPAAAAVAASHGLRFQPHFDAVLQDPDIDAVILCTPHTLHARQIEQAAAAGKHVFCEKPLCLTRDDAVHAVEACRRHGVTLGVGHERRFEPPVQALRRLVETGELGTLLQIEANFSQDKFLSLPANNWRLSETDAPAGPMTATGIHLLDLAISFSGPAERVITDVRRLGSTIANGDTLAAMVRFRSGACAMISAILATPFDGRFAIYGSRGWAEIRDKAHPESPEGWTLTKSIRDAGRETTEFAPAASVRANLEAFATAAAGGEAYPVPHEQMIATIAALEAIFRSARSNAIETVNGG